MRYAVALFFFATLLFCQSLIPARAVIVVPDEFDTANPAQALREFVCNSWELTQANFSVYGSYIFGDFGPSLTREKHLFYRPGHYISRMASMKVYVRGNRILTIPALPAGIGAEIELRVRYGERKFLSFPPHPTETQPARHILIIDADNPVFLKNNAPFTKNPPKLTREELCEKFGTPMPEFVETISIPAKESSVFVEFEIQSVIPDDTEIRQKIQDSSVATENIFPQEILDTLDGTLRSLCMPFPSQFPAGFGGSWGTGGFRDDFFHNLNRGISPTNFGKIPRWARETLQFRTNYFSGNLRANYEIIFAFEDARKTILRKHPNAKIPNLLIYSPEEEGVSDISRKINSFREKQLPNRTDFGVLDEIEFPESAHVYLEGYGNALSDFTKKSFSPLISGKGSWSSDFAWKRKAKEFVRKRINSENTRLVIFDTDAYNVPGFFLNIRENEVLLTAGEARFYEFALAVLKKVLSSENVPENTQLICVFPKNDSDKK